MQLDGESETGGVHRPFGIVLADDDPDQRFLVRAALEGSDRFEVLGEAKDGAEAVEAAARLRPDVLLLDLSMPVMNGVEAILPIREASPETKIVVLSHVPRPRLEALMRARGAVGYLEKREVLHDLPDQLLAIGGLLELTGEILAQRGLALAPDATGPRQARRFVEEVLDRWQCAGPFDALRLLVTEVVANAVVHAGSEVSVAVQVRPAAIRVVVRDGDSSVPAPRNAGPDELSGRGLGLVEAMASAWGVDPVPGGGKDVWFEVPRFDRIVQVDGAA